MNQAGVVTEKDRMLRTRARRCMAMRRRYGATPITKVSASVRRTEQVDWHVTMKPSKRRLLDKGGSQDAAEKRKASVRAKVGHAILYVKHHFGYGKVCYRGLAKNTQRIAMVLGFANLLIAGRYANV